MSVLDPDCFHRAARDGYLDLLREATRRDLNSPDEDGMTPTLWAAYYGNLDALRLIVGRGGDPDKYDYYGNTALHCSAGNGHMNCVSFLVNFGVNLWALDNDLHTAKDVAAMHQHDEILRFLDQAVAKQSTLNKKLVQKLKEKAIRDAERHMKNYQKLQAKAAKKAGREDRVLEKQRRKMLEEGSRAYHRLLTGPRYSDIVHRETPTKNGRRAVQTKEGSNGVGFVDPEVVYAPKCDLDPPRLLLKDFSDSEGDYHQTADSGIGDEILPPSIFNRPGFGSVSFRTSLSDTLMGLPSNKEPEGETNGSEVPNGSTEDSIGSVGSLAQRNRRLPWDEDLVGEDNEEGSDLDTEPIDIFLASQGLAEYSPLFAAEKIDLEALMLVREEDLKSLGLPLGPRRKIEKAISQRKEILSDPGEVADSRL